MKRSVKEGLLRGLSAVLASLFSLMLCLTAMANSNAATINVQLGTTNYIVENTSDGTADSTYFKSEFTSIADLEAAKHALAVSIASEGAVLLKNNNGALPLDAGSEKVTIWGLNSLFPTVGGLVGLAANFFLMYEPADSFMIGELPASVYTQEVLDSAEDTTAIVFLTRDSSEAADYTPAMTDPSGDTYTTPLALSEYERQMIQLAKENSNGKIVVLLNTDTTMEIGELKNDPDIDAILWTGLPGMYGFEGVANILVGNTSPSGHLVDTYAVSSLSAPAMQNFGIYTYDNYSLADGSPLTQNDKGDWYIVETEGIYLGYKYYETRYEDSVLGHGSANAAVGSIDGSAWNYADEISYPFGYGMSYTTFEQELLNVDFQVGGTSTATVRVTNTGSVAGKDVVQLYGQAPYTAGGLEKAAIQLLNFGKTDVLDPGQSQELTIEFDAQYIASYDETAVKADGTTGAWVLDAGDYYFAIGNGAHAALNNVLANRLGSADALTPVADDEVINAGNAIKVTLDTKDIETYSVGVQNALQDCDLNYYIDGAVEYMTRSDWTKGWATVTSISATDEMLVGLKNQRHQLTENDDAEIVWGADNGLTLADMMILDDDGNYLGAVELDDPLWDQLVQEITLEEAIQFIENGDSEFDAINSIAMDNAYINDGPLGYVADQVAGYATKWNESLSSEATYVGPDDEYANWTMAEMPTEPVVASTFNQELVLREGELLGEDGLWANISGIMAPGANLHRNTYCARNHEYYSEDAMLSNRMALAFCSGTSVKGSFTGLKHFAMNHMESNRSGVSTFFAEQAARENELRAFQGAAQSNAATGIMTAFNRIGTMYSGGHDGLLVQILRDEWGYTGFLVTDANNGADYMNWRDTVYGGGGACLSNTGHYRDEAEIGSMFDDRNLSMIKKDSLFQNEMQKALKYYLHVFADSNLMNGVTSDTRIVRVMTWWEKALIGVDIALGVVTAAAFVGYGVTVHKSKKEQNQGGAA